MFISHELKTHVEFISNFNRVLMYREYWRNSLKKNQKANGEIILHMN